MLDNCKKQQNNGDEKLTSYAMNIYSMTCCFWDLNNVADFKQNRSLWYHVETLKSTENIILGHSQSDFS